MELIWAQLQNRYCDVFEHFVETKRYFFLKLGLEKGSKLRPKIGNLLRGLLAKTRIGGSQMRL